MSELEKNETLLKNGDQGGEQGTENQPAGIFFFHAFHSLFTTPRTYWISSSFVQGCMVSARR